jgi:hypothetical protein
VDGGKEYIKRVGDIHGTNSKDTAISCGGDQEAGG